MSQSKKHYDVIVLGAGASGLLCAMVAARRGRTVLVLERSNKAGKKILMSGGGRCNFTNHYVSADNFISRNPHFCKGALNRYTQWDFIALVEQHGIAYEERSHGQLFCRHSAKDILDMLLTECHLAGFELKTHCDIQHIEAMVIKGCSEKYQKEERLDRYRLEYRQGSDSSSVACHSLVVATGALSIPTLGGSGLGYEIAAQFGLPVVEPRAGLVPFMFTDRMKGVCERLSGLSLPTEISCNGASFNESLLFTHRGISGPAILQISNYWQPGNTLSVDLLPGIDAGDWLLQGKRGQGKILLKTRLRQKLAKPLVQELQNLWWHGAAATPLAEYSDSQLRMIGERLNGWSLKPSTTEGYRTAEVTLGGVDTDAISSKTMEAKEQPGLYFVGEVVDVTGQLGGFNFQWAWSSGYSAGLVV